MDKRNRWLAFRGRVLVLMGLFSLGGAIFLADNFPQYLPILVLFGVGFIAMAVPRRSWKKLPSWFRRDDSWL
ncbi:MAG: hypothetical protein HOC93_01590 [Phycisphaerae bacterium]|jgi:hypothetical protein|nr:hypothetical protein [Phycisphaerae bacterium]